MRRVAVPGALLALVALSGCVGCFGPARTGWRFEVLRPPTVLSAALAADGPREISLRGLGAGGLGIDGVAVPPTPQAAAPPSFVTMPRPAVYAQPDPCLLNEILRRLDSLERRPVPRVGERLQRAPCREE